MLRPQVDVITLSATPIPRTLHMSLSGLRDMSTINTPPKERQPINTILAEYDDVLVKQAIQRELARKAQVFIVNDAPRTKISTKETTGIPWKEDPWHTVRVPRTAPIPAPKATEIPGLPWVS